MALFKGKNKDADTSAAPEPRRLRKNERLSSVFKETVMESVLADMRENSSFDVAGPADFESGVGHEVYHVAWLLEAQSIGGLSKKAARDEDRGAIIECINSNRIKVILNKAMMDMDVIGFIMDETTIDAMSEFGLLTGASYQTIYISDDASVMSTDGSVEVTFQDAEMISNGRVTCERLLASKGCSWLADESAVIDDIDAVDMQDVGEPEFDADVIESPNITGDQDISFSDADADIDAPEEDEAADESDFEVDEPEELPDADASLADIDALLSGEAPVGGADSIAMNQEQLYQEDIQRQANPSFMGREPQPTVSADEQMALGMPATTSAMTQVIRSAYYTHDLGLEITTAPFDEQFGEGNPVPEFDEDRGPGFMNEYLSQISRDANADMRHLRDSNLRHLRERYIYMMSLYAKKVTEELDVEDPETRYGRNKAQIRATYDRAIADVDARVESLRTSLQADFDRGMNEAAELAAAQAKEKYRHKHESALKQKVMDAEARVRYDIDTTYQADINKMYESRRQEAAKRMDAGEAEILGLLSHEYATMYVDEYRLYRQYRDEISKWVDNNRKEDIAYAETLREEQRQAEKADAVRAEYQAQLQQQAVDFDHRRASLEQDIDHMKARQEELMADVEARHAEELVSLRNKNTELQRQFDDLLDRYSSLDATKAQEYDLRLKQAQDEAEVERKRAEQAADQNKGTYRMVIVLLIVSVIAALCVGMVVGMRQNLDFMTNISGAGSIVLPMLM